MNTEIEAVKVFEIGEEEWIAAHSRGEAIELYTRLTGIDPFAEGQDVTELGPAEMERLMYRDDDGRRPFARQLEALVAAGETFPQWFATGNA